MPGVANQPEVGPGLGQGVVLMKFRLVTSSFFIRVTESLVTLPDSATRMPRTNLHQTQRSLQTIASAL